MHSFILLLMSSLTNSIVFSYSDKSKRSDRRVHFGRIRTHIPREDSWLQAYGWSMPADPLNGRPLLSMPLQINNQSTNYPVPVLVNCCSPLADTEPGMKVNIYIYIFLYNFYVLKKIV